MTPFERGELDPWVQAGIDVEADPGFEPPRSAIRKHYVEQTASGLYALAARGAEHASRMAEDRTVDTSVAAMPPRR